MGCVPIDYKSHHQSQTGSMNRKNVRFTNREFHTCQIIKHPNFGSGKVVSFVYQFTWSTWFTENNGNHSTSKQSTCFRIEKLFHSIVGQSPAHNNVDNLIDNNYRTIDLK